MEQKTNLTAEHTPPHPSHIDHGAETACVAEGTHEGQSPVGLEETTSSTQTFPQFSYRTGMNALSGCGAPLETNHVGTQHE